MEQNEQVSSMRLASPKELIFSTFSKEEVCKLSVVKVITPLTFDPVGHPLQGGLYDPAMGPFQGGVCATCGMMSLKCSGHMGHIELPLPVVNAIFHKPIGVLLRSSCLQCHRILVPHPAKCLLIGQLDLLHHGYLSEAQDMERVFMDLVHLDSWENVDDISVKAFTVNRVDEYVTSVKSQKEPFAKEWKGEVDLRNAYIRAAMSRLYKGKSCPYCKAPLKKITTVNNSIYVPSRVQVASKFQADQTQEKEITSSNFTLMPPTECKEHLKNLFHEDGSFIKALLPVLAEVPFDPIDRLFVEVIPVPSLNARPVNIMDGRVLEHPQNYVYKAILEDSMIIRTLHTLMKNDGESMDNTESESLKLRLATIEKLRGKTNGEKLQNAWVMLQKNVDSLMDIDVLKQKVSSGIGLKQIIEKKEGLIRMNMMGKRVDFAARTVITPDPNLNIDEIGVPEAFAKKLSYPVPVSYYNVHELRKFVINGPYCHPGANLVENEDGHIVKLLGDDLSQREGIAKKLLTPSVKKGIKIVHRHLLNGDILLLNRQPTLHKPSIMAHKARILKGERTFRMHYANCKSYNADFDGDEMNAHFPQNEVARSEGYNLVSVGKQYLVPKDGTPLSGLIQDHVISGVRLSIRGKFFTREEYMQLCFHGLSSFNGNIKILPPCMIKPAQLWSGKQIISTIILNTVPKGYVPVNLTSTAKISSRAWPAGKNPSVQAGGSPFRNPNDMTEAEVIIREGELLCGVLDKMHYGATPYSLVHCMHELYGSDSASRLLSSFSKLFTAFLQTEGFTLGVEDILVVKQADAERRKIIDEVRKIGDEVATKALDRTSKNLREDLAEAHRKDPMFRAVLDHQYKISLDSFTNNINKTCLPGGLQKKFPANDLQLMVQSGAKGSTVNTMQISCLLGQIELEGKRPPVMISGRSLPSFPPYDPSPRAGGFVDGRFMTGIRPQEFFFHCMAGREGLIDTAVKTSRSGYLQRCLVKHLEGLTVNYDLTVRDSDGSIVQYLYGEDGMDVTKSQFFTNEQLPFLTDNIQALLNREIAESLKEGSDLKTVKKLKKSLRRWKKHFGAALQRKQSPFSLYSLQMSPDKAPTKFSQKTGRKKFVKKLSNKWWEMEPHEKEEYQKLCARQPDPVIARLQPDRHFGSVTEKLDDMMDKFMKTHGSQVDAQMLEDVVYFKALSALANPGEPVGLLAAQSVGEPSTQMTLNTFHFAGRGEMNVTLGIPRLREILMVASKNIKTPSMEIPFRKDVHKLDKKADHLRRKLTRVTLANVIEYVEVTEKLQLSPRRRQLYTLTFKFLPQESYEENCTVTPRKILRHFEKKFIRELVFIIKNKGKKSKNLIDTEEERSGGGGRNEDEEEDPDEPAARRGPTRSRGVTGSGNDYQSSDEESERDDDDATTQRRRDRQHEEHQYSDLEDEDQEIQDEIEGVVKPEGVEGEDSTSARADERETSHAKNQAKKNADRERISKKEESDRRSDVTGLDQVESYVFDTEHERWCQVTLAYPSHRERIDFSSALKDLAARSVIQEVRGIRKAFLPSATGGEKVLKTDGKNIMEMYNHLHLLDINRLYTNDIHAVADTYGIEAAAKVIVKEIQNVFKVYGITVDPRHLTLIADYMTFDGTFRPLSRIGMEGGSSPLQQMSFESSLGFLKTSVLRKKKDELLSPSARLILGRPVSCGTSSFSLLYSLSEGKLF